MDGAAKDITGYTELMTLNGHTDSVNSVAWSPDGKRIASGSWDFTIKIWDPNTGTNLNTLVGHRNRVNSVAWSPDGSRLASGSWDETVRIWDPKNGTNLKTMHFNEESVFSVAWSPDGNELAATSDEGTIRIWDMAGDTRLVISSGKFDRLFSVAWSPDGKRLASGSKDNVIKLWDSGTGALLGTLKGHGTGVDSVAWSPNGSEIASGSWDDTIKIWDVASGGVIKTLTGHENNVLSVAWSPDGSMLASGSWDGTARIWNRSTGANLLTIAEYNTTINSVAWSPDGSMLATGSFDKTIKIWGIPWSGAYLMDMSVDRPNITAGESAILTAVLGNNGTGEADNVGVEFYCGQILLGTNIVIVPRQGTTETRLKWDTSPSLLLGEYTLSARVGNITKSVKVHVHGRPHVHVKSIDVDRPSVNIGGAVTISATIANNGTENANNVKLVFYDESVLLATRYLNVSITDVIKTDCVWRTTNSTLDGPHTLWAVVLSPGISWKNVVVNVIGTPNVYLENVSVDRNNISIGDTFNISAIIVNDGTTGAPNIEVRFYDGLNSVGTRNISVPRGKRRTATLELSTDNMTLGVHYISATMDNSTKWTTIRITSHGTKPRPKHCWVDEWPLMWILILVLFIIGLALYVRGIWPERPPRKIKVRRGLKKERRSIIKMKYNKSKVKKVAKKMLKKVRTAK